ncbi:MAG: hypothetical protein KJZ64_10160 [Sphingomonadaceae bacterium]|nr:hypothetical protein [Sphingomonadaceae bacterium]
MNALKLTTNAISVIAALMLAIPANAEQSQTITMSSRVAPQYVEGALVGCRIGFEVIRNDPEYSAGEVVYLTGSLGLNAFEGEQPIFTFKLGTTTLGAHSTFTPPAEVYLVDGYRTNASEFISSVEGDDAGFRLFAYTAGDASMAAALQSIIQDQRFVFTYAMQPGGLGANVPVDLRIEDLNLGEPSQSKFSDKNSKEWTACVEELAVAAEARLIAKMSDEELLRAYVAECANEDYLDMSFDDLLRAAADCAID